MPKGGMSNSSARSNKMTRASASGGTKSTKGSVPSSSGRAAATGMGKGVSGGTSNTTSLSNADAKRYMDPKA